MNDLNIPESQSTPSIVTNTEHGVLAMSGESYPENAFELFGPVFAWVENYLTHVMQPLSVELELVYLNTSSIKALMDIFDLLEAAHQEGRAASVTWFFDKNNERVGELAEEFREDCSFPFQVIGR